ncbi:MAG: PAS domain S-box protein, partial [Planctomycetota bacterium]
QDFREFLPGESKEIVADRYARRQRGEEVPSQYEFDLDRKDGERRRLEIRATVIRDSSGESRTVAHILDVTHHKRTMAECQVLYGVTMPRRGVSSRMAVSLRDVESGEVDRILEAGPEAEARRAGVEAAVPESADLRSKAPSGKGTR